MYIITVLFALGYLLLSAAVNKWMLFAGRLVCGLGPILQNSISAEIFSDKLL
jgi:predicted MFS family arabinose efflux permease